MGKVLKSNSTGKNQSAEIDDARENNEPTRQTRIHRVAVEFASSTFVGQAIMMQFDKLLWTLEKTATWISNSKTDGKRTKPPASLVRPLPWLFFLPTLVAFRVIRVMLSLVSICFGFDEIEASTMVSFLHKSRRNIRQILVEAKRNKADTNHYQSSSIDQIKQMALSLFSKLSVLISQTPDTVKVHQKKTSLNASVTDVTMEKHEKNDRITKKNDESESEGEMYQNFLTRTIESSDTDDDDFVYELNGEDTSDTDSQSSIATDDLSDDEAHAIGSTESTIDSAIANDSNHSDNTTNTVDQTEKAQNDSNDVEPSTGNETDDRLNQLIENTSTVTEAKGHPHNRGKNINRNHKNGRNNGKAQNNGKHNGAHAHAKSKTTKQHIESTTDFISEAVAADRT